MDKKKILFFFPFFGFSGSEIILLEFIKTLDRSRFEPHIYAFKKGELINYLPEEIPYHLPYKLSGKIVDWIVRKSISKRNDNYLVHQLKTLQKKHKFDLWYINTIAVNPLIYELANLINVKTVAHIHELPLAFADYHAKHFLNLMQFPRLVVTCSNVVSSTLKSIGIENSTVVYNFLAIHDTNLTPVKFERNTFSFREDDFVWLVSARTTLGKGINLLPELLRKLPKNTKIIWVGPTTEDSLFFYVYTYINKNFPGAVTFVNGQKEYYYDFFKLADGFISLSPQESFSLVCVEANYFGLPIITFDFGAAREILPKLSVRHSIIETGNVNQFAIAMTEQMQRVKRKLIQQIPLEFSISEASKRFEVVIENVIKKN